MELVTGHAGTDHISAADIASMIRGAYGDGDYVLTLDDNLACTAASANTIEIGKGGCLIQGHFCRVETAEQVTIESGSPGYYRNDLIVARYTLGDGNIQDVYLNVIKGVATTSSSPSDPSYTEGDIDGGSTLAEFPLWRIPISGVNVGTPERVMPLADTISNDIEDLRESVSRLDAHSYATDLNTIGGGNPETFAIARYSDGTANKPNDSWGACIQFADVQMALGGTSHAVYTRRYGGSSWGSWSQA